MPPHNPLLVAEVGHVPFAYESIIVADTAIGCTPATYDNAIHAELTLETGQVRIRVDGTDPTSSVGHLVEVGDTIRLTSAAQIANFRAIRTGGTSGKLPVTYFH